MQFPDLSVRVACTCQKSLPRISHLGWDRDTDTSVVHRRSTAVQATLPTGPPPWALTAKTTEAWGW